ncbi:hypothetical protein Cgig2_033522 [Carnegiea gigantea]|uniref:Endonuclease/exonuclease/phosphatase domain-containing protein n=1 Tax=Carnegiea gigantea TaxID=171969 RepID=A0A9Q1GNV7_9CARY|nr:hypothetical protein Cgig2_033522 [Carnegiea gigantea]
MYRIINLNVRGMNAPNKQEDIKIFLQQHQARMVGFLKIKIRDQNMVQQWEHNASMTDRGRIILSWHPRRYQFNLILKTDQLIHGEAVHLSTNKKFYITVIYEDPWCVLGDFNSVLNQLERIGGIDVADGEVSDFVACIKHCGLQEFSYGGAFFTWTNTIVWSRIDKALHNELWYEGFAYTHVHYMLQGLSDHTLIILSFPHCPRPRNTFQFRGMLTKDKGSKDMVKHSVAQNQSGSSLKKLQQVLSSLRQPFK